MQDGEPLTEINVYQDYVDRICKILKMLFPDATLIFATTTAVQEHLFDYYTRKNSDIRAYNEAAVEVVKSNGGVVTELYALTESAPSECHVVDAQYVKVICYGDTTKYWTHITEMRVSCPEGAPGALPNDLE